MSIDGLGPCDLASVASHVAVKLDRAAHSALSYDDLVAGYVHAIPADLSRVKRYAKLTLDVDAVRWMVVEAVAGLRPKLDVIVTDGKVTLADGKTIEDLKFQGRKVYEVQNPHAKLRDPFNPMSGQFSENIRRSTGSLDELRESMREFGWLEQFPAIKDERGVVLVGHRRLAVAVELGIEPVLSTVRCGEGDDGDARRFRLAIASNIGSKPFTPDERKRIAEYLYGVRDWTMARIGQALSVSEKTISKDLAEFLPKVRTRPKPGRPKKPSEPSKKRPPALVAEVKELVVTDSPIPRQTLADKYGVSEGTIQRVTEREVGRHEEQERTAKLPHCQTCTCTEES